MMARSPRGGRLGDCGLSGLAPTCPPGARWLSTSGTSDDYIRCTCSSPHGYEFRVYPRLIRSKAESGATRSSGRGTYHATPFRGTSRTVLVNLVSPHLEP